MELRRSLGAYCVPRNHKNEDCLSMSLTLVYILQEILRFKIIYICIYILCMHTWGFEKSFDKLPAWLPVRNFSDNLYLQKANSMLVSFHVDFF